jgi:hypothetical protein
MSERLTPDLAEGRRLLAEATVGPWTPDAWGIWQGAVGRGVRLFDADDARDADADLIAWLRNNAEALLAAAQERDRLREALAAEVCEKPDGIGDSCLHWIEPYGQEPCNACRWLLVPDPTDA